MQYHKDSKHSPISTSVHERIPRIGITTRNLCATDEYAALGVYIRAISACGAAPMLLPVTNDAAVIDAYLEAVDAILITGGDDVNPALYHEEALAQTQLPHDDLDAYETLLISKAVELDMCVFGICRGIQIMNCVFGGTLYQDIPTQLPNAHTHSMRPPYFKPWHTVSIVQTTPLAKLWEEHILLTHNHVGVNSRHHQALKDLGTGFVPMAFSDDDLIEAVYMPDKTFVQAVQWHPELMCFDYPEHMQLIQNFVNAARDHMDA